MLGEGDSSIGADTAALDVFSPGVEEPSSALTTTTSDSTESDTDPDEPRAPSGIAGDECTDDFYRKRGWQEDEVHKWWMNRGSMPDYVDRDEATARIRQGGSHITHLTTDCGYQADIDNTLAISYQGTTTDGVNMGMQNGNLVCSPSGNSWDLKSVVGFGQLPPDLYAATCTNVFITGNVRESDLRFNSNPNEAKFYTTDTPPDSCNGRIDLEGGATHERGHTFGLDDLNTDNHPNLTMRGKAYSNCSRELRTLGKGDLKGMDDLY